MIKSDAQIEKQIDLYRVDFFIPPNIVLEINGPSHFIYPEDFRIMTLTTNIRRIHLELQGFRVIFINYNEWENTKGVNKRLDFLRSLIYNKD